MINDQGGVNGRKINLIQYDDAYSPPKAVEQVGHAVRAIAATGVAILLVEQNLMLAEMIAQDAVVLETGTCVASGPAEAMLASGAIEASYLGRDARV